MPADPVADYLRTLNMSDRTRAAAWDAVYSQDDATAQRTLAQLPFSDTVRADLWDLRHGGTVANTGEPFTPASADQFMPADPQGSAASRFAGNAAEMLNPVAAVKGLYNAARHPLDTGSAILQQQGAQFGKAAEDYRQGRYSDMIGHGLAGGVPLIGPMAAEAGEQIAGGDMAGGLGKAAGLLLPVAGFEAAKGAVRGARAVASPGTRAAAASFLEEGAAGRVTDVMSPKVGANKTRFGNDAERVAPQIAKDLAAGKAPWSREGLHDMVSQKLAASTQALDAAADQRLSARTFETKPLIDALLEKRQALTADAVDASKTPRTSVERTSPIVDERGEPIKVTEQRREPLGRDVVPGPNAARVAVIDRAISELQQLGPVANYEPIRRIRMAYDGPAKAVYHPSMTADYLKAQGGKLGAADVTGALREGLAQWDPATAEANAAYSLYRTADDVLEATREIERTRPRVGRLIANRIFGTVAGGQAGGPVGAAAGYIAAPILDAGTAMGATTRLKFAAMQQRLATAIRTGNVQQVNFLANNLREAVAQLPKTTGGVAIERDRSATSPSGFQTDSAPALP